MTALGSILFKRIRVEMISDKIIIMSMHSAGMNEQSSNKSGTIEMYAPSSYNETVTGETLSSVSEKSETYSDTRQDYVSLDTNN